MRRSDREVTNIEDILEIIKSCKTCHVAMIDGTMPYVLPLSYGFDYIEDTLTLYFHCAYEGKKIDILKKNNKVCFEMCLEGEPIFAMNTPCNSGYYYASVQGVGEVKFIESSDDKRAALTKIMQQQIGIEIELTKEQADTVCVFLIECTSFTGKRKQKPDIV